MQVILPPKVSARNFGEAGLGNLKFVIGQKKWGTMDSTPWGPIMPPFTQKLATALVPGPFKQTNGLWVCPTCEGFHLDLQNGHVNVAEWSCGFCRMVQKPVSLALE